MDRWLQSLIAVAVAIGCLHFARPVLIPLAVAALLSVAFSPLVTRLEGVGLGGFSLGRVAAVLLVSAGVAAALLGVGWLLGTQGRTLVDDLPEYRREISDKLRDLQRPLVALEHAAKEVAEVTAEVTADPRVPKVEVVEGNSRALELVRAWAGSAAAFLGTSGLVVVLLVFLLIERESIRDRVIRIAGPSNIRRATAALEDATERVSRYLRALALLNLGHGLAVGLGLWFMGLPGAPLFGVLSASFRFVPYLGPWIGALAPIALSIAVFDSWTTPLLITGFFLLLELVSNNLLEPLLLGASVGLSPFGVILSAILWAWIWGPIGLVLATPLMACLVTMTRNVPNLSSLAILFGDAEPLPPGERFYQRMLAREEKEAVELIAEQIETSGPLATWDEMVLPALCLLARDEKRHLLEREELECARAATDAVLNALPATGSSSRVERMIACLPVRGWSDRLTSRALSHFLQADGIPAFSSRRVPVPSGEPVQPVKSSGLHAICLWSLDPLDVAGVSRRVGQVRALYPEMDIVLGLCASAQREVFRDDRLARDPNLHLVDSFAAAQSIARILVGRASR